MPIDGPTVKRLREAMMAGFDRDGFDLFLYEELDRSRAAISDRGSFTMDVYEVIRTADRDGWLIELARTAGDRLGDHAPVFAEVVARLETGGPGAAVDTDGPGGSYEDLVELAELGRRSPAFGGELRASRDQLVRARDAIARVQAYKNLHAAFHEIQKNCLSELDDALRRHDGALTAPLTRIGSAGGGVATAEPVRFDEAPLFNGYLSLSRKLQAIDAQLDALPQSARAAMRPALDALGRAADELRGEVERPPGRPPDVSAVRQAVLQLSFNVPSQLQSLNRDIVLAANQLGFDRVVAELAGLVDQARRHGLGGEILGKVEAALERVRELGRELETCLADHGAWQTIDGWAEQLGERLDRLGHGGIDPATLERELTALVTIWRDLRRQAEQASRDDPLLRDMAPLLGRFGAAFEARLEAVDPALLLDPEEFRHYRGVLLLAFDRVDQHLLKICGGLGGVGAQLEALAA